MSKVLIGADPEVFFKRGDKFISAIDKIGGTKAEPLPFGKRGFAVLEDNVAAEYNIPAARTPEEFAENNIYALDYLKKIAAKYGCDLAVGTPSAVFTDDELDHPMAHVFGCDPDFDAWKLETNPSPKASNPNLRSCGGHIHVGVPEFNLYQKILLVRILDMTVGQALAALEPENERSKLYGKPGAMRVKPYGVEWRTPSNYWCTSPELMIATTSSIDNIAKLVSSEKETAITKMVRNVFPKLDQAFEKKEPDFQILKQVATTGLISEPLYKMVTEKFKKTTAVPGKLIRDMEPAEINNLLEGLKALMNE